MGNINRLGRDAFLISLTRALNLLITLVTAMLLVRFRTLEEYGTYSQINTVVSIASAVFMFGLPNSLNYFIAKADNQEEKDSFLSIYYIFITVLSATIGIILYFGRGLISAYYSNELIEAFWYCLLVLPWAQTITFGISNMLVATNNVKRLVIYNISRSFCFLLLVILVQLMNGDFYTYMVFYIILDAIFTLIVYAEALKVIERLYFSLDFRKIKTILAFSIPIGLSSAASTLNIQLDHLLIGRFFDTETLAVYTNAAKQLPFTIIAHSFTAVLMPQMTRFFKVGKNEEAVVVWGRAIELNAIILFFCSMACIVFAPQMITILYSEKYISGVPVFRIYAFVLLFRITYFGMVLNTTGRTRYVLYSSIAALVVNVLLNYVLLLYLGPVGAALATVIALAVIGMAQLLLSAKFINVPFSNLFPWKRLVYIVLINSLFGFIGYMLLFILRIGTDAKDIIMAMILGAVLLVTYSLIMRKRVIALTKGLTVNQGGL